MMSIIAVKSECGCVPGIMKGIYMYNACDPHNNCVLDIERLSNTHKVTDAVLGASQFAPRLSGSAELPAHYRVHHT